MSRQSNAARIFEQIETYEFWAQKGDKLRIDELGEIFDCGTKIGHIVDEFDEDTYDSKKFLVMSLQNFRSQKSWRTHKIQLAHAANSAGYKVVFVPEFDLGFGYSNKKKCWNTPVTEHYKDLIEVAKYSQENDIKTSVVCVADDRTIGYSYNQLIDGEMLHAEAVLAEYCQVPLIMNHNEMTYWHSLLEPCDNCIRRMIERGAEVISYSVAHKEKWNTKEYVQLTNDICSKEVKTSTGRRLNYIRTNDDKINKFFAKNKEAK